MKNVQIKCNFYLFMTYFYNSQLFIQLMNIQVTFMKVFLGMIQRNSFFEFHEWLSLSLRHIHDSRSQITCCNVLILKYKLECAWNDTYYKKTCLWKNQHSLLNTTEEEKPERLVTNSYCHLQTNFRFHFTLFWTSCITVNMKILEKKRNIV